MRGAIRLWSMVLARRSEALDQRLGRYFEKSMGRGRFTSETWTPRALASHLISTAQLVTTSRESFRLLIGTHGSLSMASAGTSQSAKSQQVRRQSTGWGPS